MKQLKTKKVVNKVLALALAITMSVGMTMSVAAIPLATGVTEIEMEKHYKTPTGIVPPAELFTFVIEKNMFNNKNAAFFTANPTDTDAAAWAAMPATVSATDEVAVGYGLHTTGFPGHNWAGAGDHNFGTGVVNTAVPGIDNWVKPIERAEDAFTTSVASNNYLFSELNLTAPGVYTYKITESAGSRTDIIYSGAEYLVHINVVNDGASGVEIGGYHIVMTKDQSGAPITPIKPAKLIFENIYAAATEVSISKVVADGLGGTFKGDVNRYFEFKATVTAPATAAPGTIYKARVYDMSAIPADLANDADVLAKNETVAANGTILADARGNYIAFTSGTEVTFHLKHEQELILEEVHIAANYTVNETGVPNYVPTLDIIAGGTQGSALESGPVTGAAGSDLSSEEFDFGGTAGGGGSVPVTAGTDRADFENEFDDNPYTGLLVANLPFILMFLAAVGALGAYVVTKSRKRRV